MPPTESSNGILRNGVMDRRGGDWDGTRRRRRKAEQRSKSTRPIDRRNEWIGCVRTETIPPPRFYSGVDTVYD